jgi:hypothetical protein
MTGEHGPGMGQRPGHGDDPDRLRCFCGLHLFATAGTTGSGAWARHVAHICDFQHEVTRLTGEAARWHSLASPDQGPCALCQRPCTRYGPHGSPLCVACQAMS